MKSWFGVIIFSIVLIYYLYNGYIVWLRPKDYLKDVHARKLRLKSQFRFLPDWFIGYIFFFEHQQINVWWARILILISIIICIGGIIAGIHGPF